MSYPLLYRSWYKVIVPILMYRKIKVSIYCFNLSALAEVTMKDINMLTAKDIMTTEVVSVPPEMPVEELAALLSGCRIGGAPVIKNGKMLGVVTENDLIDQAKNLHIPTVITILDAVLVLGNPNKMDQEFQKMAGRTVQDIYSVELVSISGDTPLNEIATIMAEKGVHTLPVVEAGELVGVVGKTDLIRTISSG